MAAQSKKEYLLLKAKLKYNKAKEQHSNKTIQNPPPPPKKKKTALAANTL